MVTLIDLGEVRDDPAPEPPPRPPRRVTRPYRVVAVLVAALVVLAGGAPLPRRSALVLPAGLGADVILVGDHLYLLEQPDLEGHAGRQLVAYRIPARGPLDQLWRATLPAGGRDVAGVLEQGGQVVVSGPVGDPDAAYRTATFDARTGRPGWQLPGVAYRAGDGVLLVATDLTGGGSIRQVDAATGRTLWSVSVPQGGLDLRFGPTGVDRIMLTTTSGETEVRDAATGARLAGRDLRTAALPTWQGSQIAGDLLVTLAPTSGTITAYGLDRLEQRWTAEVPSVAYVNTCGDLVCAYRRMGGMWALDPATGSTRWSNPDWQSVLWEDGGRFLVAAPGATVSRLAVVEASTGRLVADLGNWEPVYSDQPGGWQIGVRRGRDGRLVVAELDVAAGRARVVDALPGVLGECRIDGDVVICRRSDGSFELSRLR